MSKIIINWKILGRVLVIIDAANFEHSVRDLRQKPHYTRLKRFFRQSENFVEIRFYSAAFKTKKHDDFLYSLARKGYYLITKPIKEIKSRKENRRKGDFDVEIAVDAIKHLKLFDTLILFSGDSDFDYLVREIRSRGKKVFVFSTRYHISRELINSATKYFDLKKFREDFLK